MTQGYEYSPGLDSNFNGVSQVRPSSRDRAMLRGVRADSLSLNTSNTWPLTRRIIAIPESGFFKTVEEGVLQVGPASCDWACKMRGPFRNSASKEPSARSMTVGWPPAVTAPN